MAFGPAKTPWHLYPVAVLAVLFNAIGVFDFIMAMTQGTAYLASTGATVEQVAHYETMPAWVTIIWAIGVFGAFLGALLLLMRRRLALAFFTAGLAAYLLNLAYSHLLANDALAVDATTAVTSIVIAGQLAMLIFYTRMMTARQLLR